MAAQRVQPTSDMIIWRRIRAMSAGSRAIALAEVRGAELLLSRRVEAELLGGIAELERRVVVARVLVVDDPELRTVVEVVLGQQVVVARDRGHRSRGERRLDQSTFGSWSR